jgi:hypothetical protein
MRVRKLTKLQCDELREEGNKTIIVIPVDGEWSRIW